jgi:hypothetical protein
MNFDKNFLVLNNSSKTTNLILKNNSSKFIQNYKLFLSDFKFLTYFYDKNTTTNPIIIYLGGGECIHLDILSKLFPSFEFHIYDEIGFNEKLINLKKIFLHEKKFDTEEILRWNTFNKNIYLINKLSGEFLNFQKNIIEKLRPIYSSLRFDLKNLKIDFYEYYNGLIFLNQFDEEESTENILIVSNCDSFKTWNCELYIQMCHYQNTIIRNSEFTKFNPIFDTFEFDNYDDIAFTFIISEYLFKINIAIDKKNCNNILNIIKKALK